MMSETDTPPAEIATDETEVDRRNEWVTLLVDVTERADVARRLLAAAVVDPYVVLTTSHGFRVPRWVAEDADLLFAEEVDPDADAVAPSGGPEDAPGSDVESPGGEALHIEQPVDERVVGDADALGATRPARGRRK
ncbi:hypothetical protein ACQP2T_27060 [Nonomuraea sp. CA-143628]|uniref:hypothetical protein n=1 Tax=Nonomuraea sp. CA-143628 TaxID=3239997 RepID=UPI003D950694